MSRVDENARVVLRRSGAMLLIVGLISSLGVYAGHDWFHGRLLPTLGLAPALGDALGGFAIILVAYLGLHLVSLALFRDGSFGLLRRTRELEEDNETIRQELGELDRRANLDKLTGCWNRHRLEETIRGEMDRLVRYDNALSLLVLDIDHFKEVNDRHGHPTGDRILIELAARLRSSLRASDSLTRWGGEEFVVLCPNTAIASAAVLADRLRAKVAAKPFDTVGAITLSIGVAECLADETWPEWFARADAALYRAKANGRNQVQFAPEVQDHALPARFATGHFIKLTWHSVYASGHEAIDREHQILFALANDLLNGVIAARPAEEVRDAVAVLLREIRRHFENEEAVLAAIGYPGVGEHAAQHRSLVERADRLAEDYAGGALNVGDLFQYLAHDVVAKHMLSADRDYFPYLEGQRA